MVDWQRKPSRKSSDLYINTSCSYKCIINADDGYFELLFFQMIKSRYEDKWVLCSDIDQQSALGRKMRDDLDYMNEVEDKLTSRRGHILFDRNPCHHPDFGFSGILHGTIFIRGSYYGLFHKVSQHH